MTRSEFAKLIRDTHPGQYDDLDDDTLTNAVLQAHPQYQDMLEAPAPPMMDQVVGQAAKAAVMPLTAPMQLLAGKDPTQMPNADTINTVDDKAKHAWDVAGVPEQGLKGIASLGQDAIGALRSGEPPEGSWKDAAQSSVQKAGDVVQGKQPLPGVAGFMAGTLDPRGLALGEVLNPVVKGIATSVADAAGLISTWLGSRVMQYAKRMVGNKDMRGMANEASEYATKAHPEIQDAIRKITGAVAPEAETGAANAAGGEMGKGAATVKPPPSSPSPAGSAAADVEASGGKGASLVRVPPTGENEIIPTPVVMKPGGRMFRDPDAAFKQAIKEGRLSSDPAAENYAGNHMYMGPSEDGTYDLFKNIDTRKYLPKTPQILGKLPVMPGSTTGKPYALFDFNDPITGESSYKIYGDPELTGIKTTGNVPFSQLRAKGIPVIGKTQRAADLGHEPFDDLGGRAAPPPEDPVIKGGDDPDEGRSLLKGDVKSGPKGAEFDPTMPVGEPAAPAGVDSLGQPIIHATATTGGMEAHIEQQLKAVGPAIKSTLKFLDSTGEKVNVQPIIDDLEAAYYKDQDGNVIDVFGFSPQSKTNQAISTAIQAIKDASRSGGNTVPISWDDANRLKGILQSQADYATKSTDPLDHVYHMAAGLVRDNIDKQAATLMAKNGMDVSSFQALRSAYSSLKVLEGAINNKAATEGSAKNAWPVVQGGFGGALMAGGHYKEGAAVIAQYLILRYGPQVGAQMLRAMAENPGTVGAVAGNAARAGTAIRSGIIQGRQDQGQ